MKQAVIKINMKSQYVTVCFLYTCFENFTIPILAGASALLVQIFATITLFVSIDWLHRYN